MSIHQEYITQHKLEQTNVINQSNTQPKQPVNTSKGKKLSIKFLGIQPARSLASQGASSVKWKDIYLLGCVGTCDIDLRDSENLKNKHKT